MEALAYLSLILGLQTLVRCHIMPVLPEPSKDSCISPRELVVSRGNRDRRREQLRASKWQPGVFIWVPPEDSKARSWRQFNWAMFPGSKTVEGMGSQWGCVSKPVVDGSNQGYCYSEELWTQPSPMRRRRRGIHSATPLHHCFGPLQGHIHI